MRRRSHWLLAATLTLAAVLLVLLVRRPTDGGGSATVHRVREEADAVAVEVPGVPREVGEYLRDGRAWRAARLMRRYLDRAPDPSPAAVLLAARAEAEWGGWDRVRELLEGRPWLDSVQGAEGWYWLGRAREEGERWEAAQDAYARFLRAAPGSTARDRRLVAQLRHGLVSLRLGRAEQGAAQLGAVRDHAPEIGARIDLLAAEALAVRGDTAGVRLRIARASEPDLLRRGRLALLRAYRESGDARGGRALARELGTAAASAAERAAFTERAARFALELGDSATARRELLQVAREAPASAAAAARLLDDLGGLSLDERLTLARVLDLHGSHGRAVAHYRAWLRAGRGTQAERRDVQLRVGRALFDSGELDAAVPVLAPLAELPGSLGGEALHLLARAESRRGNPQRARTLFLRLAQRHPRTDRGAEGLFMVADLSHDAAQLTVARDLYRRVAREFPGTDRAGLSLMRLAGIAFQRGDFAAAAAHWEAYRSAYPSGERWLESTYWAARAYLARGEGERARPLLRAVREREPLSYYALRAAERLEEPFWPLPMDPPPSDPAGVRQRVEGWMHGVDLLDEAGLHAEAEAEVDRWIREAGSDPQLLYPLAEVLNARGYTVPGIRIGLRLRKGATRLNPRLLRVLYPFPYRAMLVAEAREKGLDPFLVAALIRQESSFKARIASPVGARGLMQLMPPTGRALASAAGIQQWDVELLYQPEINAHLGTRFLADQMRRYDGSLPRVFAAYNAGPSRVERWNRFPEARDPELFTERIPYRETRDYVKILTRNIAVYRGLYGTAP